MDARQFSATISKISGIDSKTSSLALEALTDALAKELTNLSTVAIPGFGNFSSEKRDEEIKVDPVTLERSLIPPAIEVSFRPSVVLRKRISESEI